jgi:hypothetical protein
MTFINYAGSAGQAGVPFAEAAFALEPALGVSLENAAVNIILGGASQDIGARTHSRRRDIGSHIYHVMGSVGKILHDGHNAPVSPVFQAVVNEEIRVLRRSILWDIYPCRPTIRIKRRAL